MNDDETGAHVTVKPAWLAPAIVLAIVLALVLASKKKDEAVENPIVDLAIIAVAVAAFWALFRKVFSMLDAPGAVAFFGGPIQPHPAHANNVNTEEAY